MLAWIGARARYVLLIGCALALFLPALSAWLRPALPALVALVLGLSAARMDLAAVLRGMVAPARLIWLLGLTLLMLPVTALVLSLLPLGAFGPSAVLFALAPPISSAAALCFLLGFDARRALELTLFATLLTPLIGAVMIPFLLPDASVPHTGALMLRLAGMIAGGLLIGVLLRWALGAVLIARRAAEFDGVSALAMVLFVVPLFDGVWAEIAAAPVIALWMLIFAVGLNLGSNLLALLVSRPLAGPSLGGALGLMWGNRTVALYLAALPFDPLFSLFVAFYQFPMYATPLLFRRFATTVLPCQGS